MTNQTNTLELITPSSKTCPRCGEEKELSAFGKNAAKKDGLQNYCKQCNSDYQRNWQYIKRYGVTLEDYNEMFNEQDGCCAICGTHQLEFESLLNLDHDHDTGKVRELLCSDCNWAIGHAKEDVERLKLMIKYLEKHNGA